MMNEPMVSAREVFRLAGGDIECTPNPTAEVALACLQDLRDCYAEALQFVPLHPHGETAVPHGEKERPRGD